MMRWSRCSRPSSKPFDRQRLDGDIGLPASVWRHGFIKEWGMEQFVRDARINMIYEGTNTIQSLDLLGHRGTLQQRCDAAKVWQAHRQAGGRRRCERKMAEFINPLAALAEQMTKFTTEVDSSGFQNPDEVGAAAKWTICVCWGTWCLATFCTHGASKALGSGFAAGSADPYYTAKLQTARFTLPLFSNGNTGCAQPEQAASAC